MATRFTAIDLSQVTPPPVVVPPDAEADIAARKADIVARILPYDAALAADVTEILKLESEPMTKLTEVGAYRELLHYARVNSAALAVMIAFAQGEDLDVLGQYYGVSREVLTPASGSNGVVMEGDDSLRRRIQLAPEAFSTAGPAGAYIFFALSVDADILDVAPLKVLDGDGNPTGGVQLRVVTRDNNGVPSADLLRAIANRFRDDALTPLTDSVTVVAADFVDYAITINLEIGYGPDPATVIATATAAINAYLQAQARIGQPINTSMLTGVATTMPVRRSTLTSPASDINPGPTGFARCTGITVTTTVQT